MDGIHFGVQGDVVLGEGRLALDEAIDSLLQVIRGDLASVVFGND